MTPRFIRLKDAPDYLGMGPHTFERLVRPNVHEVPIAIDPTTDRRTGIAFDRLELDAWATQYVRRYGRPPAKEETWQEDEPPDSSSEAESGTWTSAPATSRVADFGRALERLRLRKRSGT